MSAEPQHRLRVRMELDDEHPYIGVVCPFDPDDPARPCLIIDCPVCVESAARECLVEHGATAQSGCNFREWHQEDGTRMKFLVELPITSVEWTGEGYDLIVEVTS